MKLNKLILIITFLIIVVISSIFYIPFRRYAVSTIDLKEYNTKEYYHIYNMPKNEYINVKPSGQLNFEEVELKYSVVHEELILRYIIVVMFLIIAWNSIPETFIHDMSSNPNKQYSMRWYKALINFFIPLWLIISPIYTYTNINTRILNYYGNWGNYLSELPNALSLSIYLLNLIILVIAYIELRKYSNRGYKAILFFFMLAAAYPIIEMIIFIPSYLKANVQFDYAFSIGRALNH